MAQDGFPHLVPLSTLQQTLQDLYPFDILDRPHQPLDPAAYLAPFPMTQPPQSPNASASPVAPSDVTDSSSPDSSSAKSSTPATSEEPSSGHRCQWIECDKVLPDPESLYNHLCNDHIGRKSTGNLCLTCRWKDCGTTCAKRDHITSHLRGTCPSPVLWPLPPSHLAASPYPS